ncbi:MetQ/NlpA family ABC transporter substrate-binding protein [Nonomuraea dietziae]|uniref:Lipoprotein n=1 Tax=Nonomuraea dietziae TaxID=65515 RepID=A0A7W5YSM9_9ACTN|nr:MetQ/NlpA family ABC transporter substrate-binding protein [Nonomuraea dietziae]MBB3732592.1 D-methionine transport system substrate-binding protein [Nonomuraea dietziae]
MRTLFGAVIAAFLALVLTACGSSSAGTADDTLKVGATPTPHGEILKYISDNLAAKEGLKLEIVEFSDYVPLNPQLQEGQLDANYFQHQPYLGDYNKEKGAKLTWVESVHLEPLGLYSSKVKDVASIASGASVAVPNDATNLGRALKLLADNGVITLKEGVGTAATERDVTANPKNIAFKPLDAAQLPRSLEDVDAAVINGNYALEAKLNPATDALVVEKAEGNPYANGLVVQDGKQNDPLVQKLAKLLKSPEVKKYIEDTYKGAVIPA